MIGRGRTFLRLAALQASWTYERMQGVGIAFAMEPLLGPLAGSVLLRQDDYRNLICSKLLETGTCPNVAIAVPDPVSGAVALARRAVGYPARQL